MDISFIQNTLRLEHLNHGRTLLEERHCPDDFLVQEFGINQFIHGEMEILTQDGSKHHVPEGGAVFIPAGIPHKFINLNPGRTVSIWNNIHFSIMDTIDPLTFLEMPYILEENDSRKVSSINCELENIEMIRERNFLEYIAKRNGLAMRFFEIIISVSELKLDIHKDLSRIERLRPAFRYVKDHLKRKITTKKLASLLHVSEPRLFELFREALKISPIKYVQQQRMRKAQAILISSSLRISEICEEVGYNDQFHFSRLFKKNFGLSPENFRKQWSG